MVGQGCTIGVTTVPSPSLKIERKERDKFTLHLDCLSLNPWSKRCESIKIIQLLANFELKCRNGITKTLIRVLLLFCFSATRYRLSRVIDTETLTFKNKHCLIWKEFIFIKFFTLYIINISCQFEIE